MYYIVVIVWIALDGLTKHWIQTNMTLNDTIPVIDGIFHITYINNYGAAFSILEGKQGILLFVTGAALLGLTGYLIWARRKNKMKPMGLLALSTIIGGGLGNLIDRIRLGFVVDFLDFRVWPIFNVADIAVCCGCALLLFYVMVWEPRLEKQEEEARLAVERPTKEKSERQADGANPAKAQED